LDVLDAPAAEPAGLLLDAAGVDEELSLAFESEEPFALAAAVELVEAARESVR
jgi:hypothetical protein